LDELFEPDKEILIVENTDDVLRILRDLPATRRVAIAEAARRRVLAEHSSERRARQLEMFVAELHGDFARSSLRSDSRRAFV
jgi:spore maturation protein CgeB